MLSRSASAGMSQKTRPSANKALSLSVSWFSVSVLCSALFFFLILFLLSASSQSNFSFSVSGDIWLTGADFPDLESRATNVKFAIRATDSDVYEDPASQVSIVSTMINKSDIF